MAERAVMLVKTSEQFIYLLEKVLFNVLEFLER